MISLLLYHLPQSNQDRMTHDQGMRAYERYKRDWENTQSELFLNQYMNDPWFKERYDLELLDSQDKEKKVTVKEAKNQFISDIQQGFYSQLNLVIQNPASLGYLNTRQGGQEDDDKDSTMNLLNGNSVQISLNSTFKVSASPFYGFDQDHHTLFIKSISKSIGRYDIYEIVSKLQGFKSLTLSEPVKKLNFSRHCWIQFNSEEAYDKALQQMSGVLVKKQPLVVSKSNCKSKRFRVLQNYPINRLEEDSELLVRLIIRLDNDCGINQNELCTMPFPSQSARFDTLLLYLRRVHAYDYFTNKTFENERLLTLKLGAGWLRTQANYQQKKQFQTIFKIMKQKAEARLQKPPEVIDFGLILKEEIEKFIRETEKTSKEDAEAKKTWQCFACEKKFRSCEFLAKHIIVRHPERKAERMKIYIEDAYRKDPIKITAYQIRAEDPDGFRKRRNYNRQDGGSSYGGPRRGDGRRRDGYRDWDEPETERVDSKVSTKPIINYSDI